MAEYKSDSGPDDYHLAVYEPASGSVLASLYNKDTEMIETYAIRNSGRDDAAVLIGDAPGPDGG